MKRLIYSSLLVIVFALNVKAQTVDATYLKPKYVSSNYDFLRFGDSSSYYGGFMLNKVVDDYGDGNDFSIFTYNNRDLTFKTGTGNLIIFPSLGGNVGIGTTAPTHKLSVKGSIRAKEIECEFDNWPDYVFTETYELKSLDEVSIFINENGHLPNIPSAKEVAANGVKLTEMSASLLEKVEELTLYTIEQNDQLATQNQKIATQDKQLKSQEALIQSLIERIENLEK